MTNTPTDQFYNSLTVAYNHFNESLFQGELPNVIFTVQRRAGVMGFFAGDRWSDLKGEFCSEISINPSYIANSRLEEVLQTLVHEMVHCWQHFFGKPSRNFYHNQEWARKMIAIGLMPSSTGEPGGRLTGQAMSDYIIEDGEFLIESSKLTETKNFKLLWLDRKALPRLFDPVIAPKPSTSGEHFDINPNFGGTKDLRNREPAENTIALIDKPTLLSDDLLISIPEKKPKNKSKYQCHSCLSIVYGKPNLNIRCDDCNVVFTANDGTI